MHRLLLTLAAATAMWAQDKVALIEVKYVDVNRLAALISGLGVPASPQAGFKAITVRGSAEAIAAAEEMAKKLDVPEVPAPNIELTVHLLYGAAQDTSGDTIPQDLAATVKQLRSLFQYKSYRVVETFMLRGRDGQQTQTSGTLPGSQTTYQFQYRPHVLPGSVPRMVRIDADGTVKTVMRDVKPATHADDVLAALAR